MYIAAWNGIELARSDRTIEIEHNQYFPPQDVKMEYSLKRSIIQLVPGKGIHPIMT